MKVPKAVAHAAKILADKGLEITGQNLKEHLDTKEYNSLSSIFRQHVDKHAEHKEKYSMLKDDTQRRNYMAQFVMDPQDFKAKGKTTTSVIDKNQDKTVGEWLFETQIGGPMVLNNPELAAAI